MQPVKLLTANLFKDGADNQALADVLSRVRPDIMAAQELTHASAEVIADEFPFRNLSPFPEGSGIGLAARRRVGWDDLLMPHRPGQIATLHPDDWPEFDGPVEVLAVHLISPIEWDPLRTSWKRRGQVQSVVAHAAQTYPRRVLCGDLNATPLWPAYRRLVGHYSDGIVRAQKRQGRRPVRTWGPTTYGPRLLRIDHVLVSGLAVTAAATVRIDGSDHLGVVADLADTTLPAVS